jgi:maltose O-acetyltransferase
VKKLKRLVFLLIAHIQSIRFVLPNLRAELLRSIRITVGKNTEIRSNCVFVNDNVQIGDNVFINQHCYFHSSKIGRITIEENCDIGMNVLLCTITHETGNSSRRAGRQLYMPITIKKGTWIGANSTILPGVTIGEGCIIAAGSVVNKDCEPNGLYAGVPARRIKDLK